MNGVLVEDGRTARKPVLSSMWAGDKDSSAQWNATVEVLARREHPHLVGWLVAFVRASRGRRAVVLLGTVSASDLYCDFLVAIVLRLLRSKTHVVISDATIEPGSATLQARLPRLLHPAVRALTRAVVGLADSRRTTWCVLSEDEVTVFPSVWPIRRGRVVFTPFSHTLHGVDLDTENPAGEFLFSGGNSLRDYPLLLDAVRGLDVPLVVASRWDPGPLPEHVCVRPVAHGEFVNLLRRCRAVVLTLQDATRSTGQQTYLNAMALGKVVVVTGTTGVASYVQDGVTGIVTTADATAVRAALRRVLDPANAEAMAVMGAAARRAVLARHTPEQYRATLLALAVGERG